MDIIDVSKGGTYFYYKDGKLLSDEVRNVGTTFVMFKNGSRRKPINVFKDKEDALKTSINVLNFMLSSDFLMKNTFGSIFTLKDRLNEIYDSYPELFL